MKGVGRFQTAKVFLRNLENQYVKEWKWCWSLSNSEGVSPQDVDGKVLGVKGVGRFQTAKVFLLTAPTENL